MSAIDQLFSKLRSEGRKAFMPFITAGDPNLAFTQRVITELAKRGSHLCEVGIPYSDPIADGPVIQASYTRALEKETKLSDILHSLSGVSGNVSSPIVTMVSYAIVYRHGLRKYIEEAQQAGIAGAIVPDLPVEESDQLSTICKEFDFSLIQLITPTTPRDRALRIASSSTGFVYFVSVTGITGERRELPPSLLESVSWLRTQTELPICIGFGINSPEHVRTLAPVADGLIVGSAIVRRMASAKSNADEDRVLQEVGDYASQLLSALNESQTESHS